MVRTPRSCIGASCPCRTAARVTARSTRHGRKGIAALIAMLYLVIFSTLALGFYASVTLSSQVAHNDERSLGAHVAAESGMQFMRYHLSKVSFPGGTPQDRMLKEVCDDLVRQTITSDNLKGRTIGMTGGTIYLPGDAVDPFIALDEEGGGFRASVTDLNNGSVLVKIIGRYRGVTIVRAIEMEFRSVPKSSSIFDYGIVTRGPIQLQGNASIGEGAAVPAHQGVLSLYQGGTALDMKGNTSIVGDVYMTNPNGSVSISGKSSVGGSTIPAVRDQHIHAGDPTPAPEFPTVDSTVFLPYVTNVYKPGQSVYRNVRVPANTNPSFSSDTTIEGVMYVDAPNQLKFSGKTTVRGVIVVNSNTTSAGNSIKFTGQFTAYGIETLPATPEFPAGLRALTGSTILAPGFDLSFGGQAASLGGTMVANSFSFQGNSGGNVIGTLIGLGELPLTMGGNPSFSRTKPTTIPAGLIFTKTFQSVPDTYLEVLP
jgi:hypothetical protein